MLLGTLGSSLLGNLLTGKGTVRAREETVRAGEGIKKKALIPENSSPHPLINFEMEMSLDSMVLTLEIIYLK